MQVSLGVYCVLVIMEAYLVTVSQPINWNIKQLSVLSRQAVSVCPCVRVKQAVISPRAVEIQGLATISLFCIKVIHAQSPHHESANNCSYHTYLTLKFPDTVIIPKITSFIK